MNCWLRRGALRARSRARSRRCCSRSSSAPAPRAHALAASPRRDGRHRCARADRAARAGVPRGRPFPFWFSAYWPLALTCIAGLYAIRGIDEERELRAVLLAYLAFGTLAWLVRTRGGNITRLGSLFAGPVLAAVVLTRPVKAPRVAVLAALALALGWQVVTPIPDTFQSLGDPSTAKAYYAPLDRWLSGHGAERERVEVPYTFNHWETAYLAPKFALARGWLRQADVSRNRLFYDGRLTSDRYREWLHENGVRWVALPDSRLDYSAQKEAAIVAACRPTCGCALRAGALAHLLRSRRRPDAPGRRAAAAAGSPRWAPSRSRFR